MAQMVLNRQLQNGTAASLSNHTLADMKLIRCFSFSGQFKEGPEVIIKQGRLAHFIHLKGHHGSSGGVIYSITGSHGEAYAVLLAWDAPANFNAITSPNKLLGICGPKAFIDSLDEDTIKNELDKAGSTFEYIDKDTKIVIHANIVHNPINQMADLFADFQLMR